MLSPSQKEPGFIESHSRKTGQVTASSQPVTQLTGIVERIIYQNDDWAVISLTPEGQLFDITVVGSLFGIAPDQTLCLSGGWTQHPTYGEQFKVESFYPQIPATAEGLRAYLASGLVPGVGPVTAAAIVDTFGEDTLAVLDNAPHRLTETPGVGKKRADAIAAAWQEQRRIADLMMFLQGHGVSAGLAARIYKAYGDEALSIVRTNPYRITEVHGFGFLTADKLAQNLGLAADDPFRVEAALRYVLETAENEGHIFLSRTEALDRAGELLGEAVSPPAVEQGLTGLLHAGEAVRQTGVVCNGQAVDEAIYGVRQHRRETRAATNLRRLLAAPVGRLSLAYCHADWPQVLARLEDVTQLTLAERQAGAVRAVLNRQVTILTGGPGTGKTTAIRSILALLAEQEAQVILAAPTGRAAKRMSEATGSKAYTIHRLLEADGKGRFNRDEENPLEADLVIIDEMSMVDLRLFDALLRAIPLTAHLLLVGDPDQLPSVGAGDVLAELIRSKVIPTIHLDIIFRQAEQSSIITNAHRINRGELPVFPQHTPDDSRQDFFWFGLDEPERIADKIVELAHSLAPDKLGVTPGDIQVLSPMRRGPVGVEALNTRLQAALNPPQRGRGEYRTVSATYRVGDRVMQIHNDYGKGVFNGDVGRLVNFDPEEGKLWVDFDGRPVEYQTNEVSGNLVLAYATTIHKSQGSEYPVVVIPVTTSHYVMLARNLFYTGVTRAKQCVVMVGSRRALAIAVKNNQTSRRWSGLAWRLAG